MGVWYPNAHYDTNLNAEYCHKFAIYMFRLVESYNSFRVKQPLEILQPKILWYSQEYTCVGVSLFS